MTQIYLQKGCKATKIRKHILAMAEYAINKFELRDSKVNIVFDFVKLEKGYNALCWPIDKGIILIQISKEIPSDYVMNTAAHEIIHAKQYILKEMTNKRWKGFSKKHYPVYHKQPWEIEAFSNAEILALEYLHSLKG